MQIHIHCDKVRFVAEKGSIRRCHDDLAMRQILRARLVSMV